MNRDAATSLIRASSLGDRLERILPNLVAGLRVRASRDAFIVTISPVAGSIERGASRRATDAVPNESLLCCHGITNEPTPVREA